jgi:hypothetical protein
MGHSAGAKEHDSSSHPNPPSCCLIIYDMDGRYNSSSATMFVLQNQQMRYDALPADLSRLRTHRVFEEIFAAYRDPYSFGYGFFFEHGSKQTKKK